MSRPLWYEISGKKFTFAQPKRFPPKHNLPVRENNSLEQTACWREVEVVCCLPTPLVYTMLAQLNTTDQSSIVCCCCCYCCSCCFNLIFALLLFLFISHYLKKNVHEPGPWQRVHGPSPYKSGPYGPGPKWGSMFCPHPNNSGNYI